MSNPKLKVTPQFTQKMLADYGDDFYQEFLRVMAEPGQLNLATRNDEFTNQLVQLLTAKHCFEEGYNRQARVNYSLSGEDVMVATNDLTINQAPKPAMLVDALSKQPLLAPEQDVLTAIAALANCKRSVEPEITAAAKKSGTRLFGLFAKIKPSREAVKPVESKKVDTPKQGK